MTKITLPVARRLLKNAIKAKGADYVTPATCVYFQNSEPSCIVAVALAPKGLTEEMLNKIGTTTRGCTANSAKIAELAPKLAPYGFEFTAPALKYLGQAQNSQDVGLSWGYSESEASREVARNA